ncbi:zinc finger protein 185 isoform X2 [Melanerpes formicivorus]|uniref:zinc finger protein 185 isoform X2 n=1 Tax=Melanerpes formicivorus TaxID=211600 RepID=UPI00358F8F3B
MMSLGVSKGGVIAPTDEDRRRIIKQMKVRTTLKGDKSWIQHHNSDSEDEKSSPRAGRPGGGSPASKPPAPQSNRSPASKPQSGYLIRGVFTKTIDKTSSGPGSSSSNGAQKSTATKGPSVGRSSSGYRMTTEDYKKLAPYNVKQKSVDLDEEDVPFTPDEHKKRTEAANSVLRSTASRERAYVLSAAKKSNGSPTQEFPPLVAKRIEVEEEESQQRRSSTVSGSCSLPSDDSSTNGLRKTSPGSSWNEQKPTAVSPSSPDTGSKSQTITSFTETTETISISTKIRNGENRQAPDGKPSSEAVSQHGDGHPEHPAASNGFHPPKANLQPDAPPPPTGSTNLHLENTEYSFRRSVLGYEERSSSQESRYTSPGVPPYSKPYWNETMSSQDFKEGNTPREKGHESTGTSAGSKPELVHEGFLDSKNHSEKGQESSDHDVHPEPPRLKEHSEYDPSMSRSSSLPRESSTAAPEIQPANESDPSQERITPACEEQTHPATESHQESTADWRQNESSSVATRSNFSSAESSLGVYEAQHPMPDYLDRHVPAPSHRIPSYVDSQAFSTRRPAPGYEGRVHDGRSSPRSSRYDTARGHCDFSPAATCHDSLPRDTSMSFGQRSHRVPFYMDSLNYNSSRLLSSSSERICGPAATLQHNSPMTSGYQLDSGTAGGVLFVKQYLNSSGSSASPRYGSLADLTDLERSAYSHHSYLSSAPLQRSSDPVCTYCSREIRDCPKIIIEHLNIYCHEYCFRCGICHKAMGDLLDKIFIHRDIVHCDKCYEKLF